MLYIIIFRLLPILVVAVPTLGVAGDFDLSEKDQVFWVQDPDTGILYIQADGEFGEDATASRTTARSGSSGGSGGHITLIVTQLPTQAFIFARGGDGGDGADGRDGRDGYDGRDGRDVKLFRRPMPESGMDGGDGENGWPGSHGGHGGSGGKVRIVYLPENDDEKDWPERFEIDVSGGQGGKAGQGGEGGKGGEGGRGGSYLWSSSRAEDGKDGKDGKAGKDGQAGMDGQDGTVEFWEADDLEGWMIEELKDAAQKST